MTVMPTNMIMSRVIPHGVESMMFSIGHSIINLNLFTLRSFMGVVINECFVHVTKEEFDNFYVLEIISLTGALIPFIYMRFLIPKTHEVEELE